MKVITKSDVSELEKKAGEALSFLLNESENQEILLLVSGGSALRILAYVPELHSPLRITLGVLDERFTKDERENNCAELKKKHLFLNEKKPAE